MAVTTVTAVTHRYLGEVGEVSRVESYADGLVADAEKAECDAEEVAHSRLDGVVTVDQSQKGRREGLRAASCSSV